MFEQNKLINEAIIISPFFPCDGFSAVILVSQPFRSNQSPPDPAQNLGIYKTASLSISAGNSALP